MARILIDHSRSRRAGRHRHGIDERDPDEIEDTSPQAERLFAGRAIDLVALGDALARLEAKDPKTSDVVYLYFFLGLTFVEVGEALGISESAARRAWKFARNWLRRNM